MNTEAGARNRRPLHDTFTAVPPHYDVVNRIITWGMDEKWRRLAARECLAGEARRVLDLACGTGDLAMHIAGIAGHGVAIVGVDFSRPMLDLAKRKAQQSSCASSVAYVHGDAAALPFPSASLDCVGVSFAFRNLTYRNPQALRYLSEILRVLRPGGRLVIVESSQPGPPALRKLFHLYLRWFVARVGHILSGHRTPYRLLAESAARYYAPGELGDLLTTAGFSSFQSRHLLLGAVAIHTALK